MALGEERNNWFYFGDLKSQIEKSDPSEWSGEILFDAEKKIVEDSISFLLEDRYMELTMYYPAGADGPESDDDSRVFHSRKGAKYRGHVVVAASTGETVELDSKLSRELYRAARNRIVETQFERARQVISDLQTTLPLKDTRLKWDVLASPYGSGWEKYSAERFEEEGVDLGDGRVLFDDSGAQGFVSRLNDCIVVARKEAAGGASLDVFALIANRVHTESLQGAPAESLVNAIEKLAADEKS